ncbi:MAG: BrnT family toxin [Lachnospiraceae bacterium]|nr:BrnT family toxin [Lachnospiraceae bacterium]MBQ2101877.1 BrnT family toxin [Lachnospiraceae bacterium]MBQ3906135.1 BrnT family toxin [Lachnospiraceae bacterium]
MRFEWDENKNQINQEKHNVSFEEAQTVFYDDEALLITDPDHSEDEERFLLLGFSSVANMLVVVHCYRANDSVIRIISARKATKSERKQYDDRAERW